MSRRPIRLARFLAFALVSLAAAAPLGGQVVRGRLVDAQSERPVQGATVRLVPDRAGVETREVVTDSGGAFRFRAPEPGTYRVAAERVGYARSTSEPMRMAYADSLQVVQRISATAVVLEPLEVVARERRFSRRLEGYFRRLDRGVPGAVFRTREDVDRMRPIHATDLLATTRGLHLRPRRGRGYVVLGRGDCLPKVYLDGMRIEAWEVDDWVVPTDLEGIEVYPYGDLAPPEYGALTGGCAVVLLWTRS